MDCSAILSAGGNVAQIVTGVVASVGGTIYLSRKQMRRSRLERYLEKERQDDEPEGKTGTRSVLHLMGHLSMTEAEVLDAAFNSRAIRTWVGADDAGRADRLLFQSTKRPSN